MPLHDGQKKYLRESYSLKRKINILTCANRWGKSVIIACIQLHHLFYKIGLEEAATDDPVSSKAWDKAGYRTASLAPHSANTEAVFRTIHQIMTSSFSYTDPKTGKIVSNRCNIEWFYLPDKTLNTPPYKQYFGGGETSIEYRSLGADQGDSIADKKFGLITYDEGGRSDHLEDEVRGVILARLFDLGGQLHIISTPDKGSKSTIYYYQLYKDGLAGINNTYTMTGRLRDNTFFTPEQIQEQYDLYKDDPLRDQVLEGKFVFGGDSIFDGESIIAAATEELNNPILYQDGHRYVVGIDSAIGSDEMVYYVLDVTQRPFKLVNYIACKGNSKSPQLHLDDLVELVLSYYKPELDNLGIILETWNGESIRFYHDLPPLLQSITTCYGAWKSATLKTENKNLAKPKPNAAKKADILISLRKLLSAGDLKLPKNDTKLLNQLSIYREDDAKLQTDRVMALALACHHAVNHETNQELVWQSVEW